MKKTKSIPKPDDQQIAEFMDLLVHPLKKEIEAVRTIIKNADDKINERIKWNAPSYYYKADFVTFNPRNTKQVHLVFHHPSIVNIRSVLLEGDYKDRRMAYFNDMNDIISKKKELERIIKESVAFIVNPDK
jgi:hypothetical protein